MRDLRIPPVYVLYVGRGSISVARWHQNRLRVQLSRFFELCLLVEDLLNPLGQLADFSHVDSGAGNNFAEIHGSAGA